MRRYIRIIGISFCVLIPLFLSVVYLYQMNKRGGFESIPDNTPLPSLRVTKEKHILHPHGDFFSFAVLGDMRWTSEPRITVLKDAQKHKPLFMVNLGDVVEFGRKAEWEQYIEELRINWNIEIPYFHVPGSHSINPRITGIYPAFYEHYFGKTSYSIDVGNWRFIFVDTSKTYLPYNQARWLSAMLNECKLEGKRAIIFTHCPPMSLEHGITHSMTKGSTERLAKTISGHDVAAIFAAHIHKTLNYLWNGIPVYITSLNDSTWTDNQSAEYLNVSVSNRQIEVKSVKIFKRLKRRF